MLLSAKCKEAKTEDFVKKATVRTINGGVYGSGYSTTYTVQFTDVVKKELTFDSIWIDAGNQRIYRRVSTENGWSLKRLENETYTFTTSFSGGEKVQANGSVKFIEIPSLQKPEEMTTQGLIFGKYNGKRAVVKIEKFTLLENLNMP